MTYEQKQVKSFERDIKRLEKEPQSEGRDRSIAFCMSQIKQWSSN